MGGKSRYAPYAGRLSLSSGSFVVHPPKPDWSMATYIYKGTSNKTSYDYTRPEAYRRKDERPSGRTNIRTVDGEDGA